MIIDSHQHFWKYDAVKHSWIDDSMQALKNDFLPADLAPLLKRNNVDGCIAVQADENDDENQFLLKLADECEFINGVIGWIDMISPNAVQLLDEYAGSKKMKGFRYVLQDKANRSLMLEEQFLKNIRCLGKYNFTYDILIFRDQLLFANELIKQFPEQKFIIDHLAKPAIKNKEIEEWRKHLIAVSKNENAYCKLSGMVTEADWDNFTEEELHPYMDTVLEAFGTKRVLYGSDWPVCTLAASYDTNFQIVKKYISALSLNEQADILGNNAMKFYNL